MDFKRYRKYFLARTFWFRYVGIGLVVLGAAMFLLGYMNYNYFIMPTGVFFVILGGVVGWAPSTGRADDKEIISAISRETEGAVDKALDATGLRSRVVGTLPPMLVSGFEFDVSNPYVRRGDDGHWRTSDCAYTTLIFTKLGICAVTDRFSLTDETAVKTEQIKELTFSDFDGAHFADDDHLIAYGNASETARFSRLVFTLGGEEVFSVPAERTASVEIAVDDILKLRQRTLNSQNN